MKIVSLLPSATEIVFALGLGDQLEGVSFECNWPPEARTKPIVSGTALEMASLTTAAAIDTAVRSNLAAGEPIYTIDRERIATIKPDLILAQDLCRVCAVPSGAVEEALDVIGCRVDVVSLDPASLGDVIALIGVVGEATGRSGLAGDLMAGLRARVAAVREAVAGLDRPRVFALEWSDPPFNAGHWVPDMIDAAGGEPVLAETGVPSRQVTWAEVAAADPEVVVFMPCGYDLEKAAAEGASLRDIPELAAVPRIVAVDGDAYFSRPGPRVVDGVETLAALLHPTALPILGGLARPQHVEIRPE
ncbi:MAG TPA: cobalamin-binding protein [Acidimicrobiales bacterium]|nr:cobalamin-binding protein [Acidimicrobiales bacterium]